VLKVVLKDLMTVVHLVVLMVLKMAVMLDCEMVECLVVL
jgi:hypothetical protein